MFALLSVAVRVAWLAVISLLTGNSARTSPREYVFFQTQLGIYSICLLTANLLNSVAGVIGIAWLKGNGITEGPLCIAQAVMNQIGNLALAYFTITIAIHTFSSLVLHKRHSVWLASSVIVAGWFFALAAATFPMLVRRSQGPIYGDAGLSCGFRGFYPKPQFFLHLFPIFLASFISVVLYSTVFLVLRGTFIIKGGIKFTLDPNQRWGWPSGTLDEYHHLIAAIARSMLWYPFAYIVFLLPYSIVHLLALSGFAVSFGVTVFAFVCWFLLGFVNVLLLYHTFRVLGPACDARPSTRTRKDTDSFFSPFRITQTTPSLLGPGKISPSGMDEKMAYNFPRSHPVQSSLYPLTHQSTPSDSSDASHHPLLSGHRYPTSNVNPASLPAAQSLQLTSSPYSEPNRQVAAPEPAWRLRYLRVDTNVIRGSQASTGSPSLTPAARYNRTAFERRPTIASIPSPEKGNGAFDGSRSLTDMPGRLNHRHPPLGTVPHQTSFRPSHAPTMITNSDYGWGFDYKPSPPPTAVVRFRETHQYPNSAISSSPYGSVPQDVKPRVHSPRLTTRVLPAPQSNPPRRRPPLAFDPNAMVRSPSKPASPSSTPNMTPTQSTSPKHF